MNKRKFCIIAFAVSLFIPFRQFSQSGREDSLAMLLSSDKLYGDQLYHSFYALLGENFSKEDLRRAEVLANEKSVNGLSVSAKYALSKIKIARCSQEKDIGKALVIADEFYNSVKSLDPCAKILAYTLYTDCYGPFQMKEEEFRYLRLKTHQIRVCLPERDIMEAYYSYGWFLSGYGFDKKDTMLLDSAARYQHKVIEISDRIDSSPVLEYHNVYILTLLRLKRYQTAIEATRLAYNILVRERENMTVSETDHFTRLFTRYISNCHRGLGNKDSALYYFDRIRFATKKEPANTICLRNAKYMHYQELIDLVFIYTKFGDTLSAVKQLSEGLFSRNKITDQEILPFLRGIAAPLFLSSGKYEEAAICYREKLKNNDSLRKFEEKVIRESYLITNKLQISAANENARLESEKQSLVLHEERTRKKTILAGAILIAVLLLSFLLFLYNRFKLIRNQKHIIEKQKLEVDAAYEELDIRNREVVDSIHYARRIQRTLMPSESGIEKILNRLNK